jgi:hypothetical protein
MAHSALESAANLSTSKKNNPTYPTPTGTCVHVNAPDKQGQTMACPVPLTTEVWARIRYEYESTTRKVVEICAEHGISEGTEQSIRALHPIVRSNRI